MSLVRLFLSINEAPVDSVIELANPSRRGRVVGAQQWAITWGILIMFYISFGCSYLDGPKAFRVPWGLQALPAAFLLGGLFFLPEVYFMFRESNHCIADVT